MQVRKVKKPPPVPCESSFGNPLIERGASPPGFGSRLYPQFATAGAADID